jgi:hypothetical protein
MCHLVSYSHFRTEEWEDGGRLDTKLLYLENKIFAVLSCGVGEQIQSLMSRF